MELKSALTRINPIPKLSASVSRPRGPYRFGSDAEQRRPMHFIAILLAKTQPLALEVRK